MELAIAVAPEDEETAVAAAALCGTRGTWSVRPGLVRAYFAAGGDAPAAAFAAAWSRLAPGLPEPDVVTRAVPEEDWLAGFRRGARPVRAGERLWIVPDAGPERPVSSGAAPAPPAGIPAGAVVVRIRPGQGFGTGTHPTTRALLRRLEAEPARGDVLDVGTGSGILALAALALGARRAVALEVDPAAVDNAAVNRALNRARGLQLARATPAALRPGARFERVLANLDRAALGALIPDLAVRVAPDGRLGVAGLLAGEEGGILALAERAGLALAGAGTEADPGTGDRWWSGWFRPAVPR